MNKELAPYKQPNDEPTQVLELTRSEAWTIDRHVRYEASANGYALVGQDLLLKVFDGIRQLDRGIVSEPFPIAITENECWLLESQIRDHFPDSFTGGTMAAFLMKVQECLLRFNDHFVVFDPRGMAITAEPKINFKDKLKEWKNGQS